MKKRKKLDKEAVKALRRIHHDDQMRAREAEELARLSDKLKKEMEREDDKPR